MTKAIENSMAQSKVSNSEILTYLKERKKSLKKELAQVEEVLNSIGSKEKSSGKKGKNKDKKKLEKAVKAIRKKVTQAIEGVKNQAETLVDSFSSSDKGTKAKSDAAIKSTSVKKKAPSKKAVEPTPDTASATEIKQEPAARTRKPRVAEKPASAAAVTTVPAVVAEEKKLSTMDEKIRYALSQKRNSTKEELIEYLNGLDPDYGLSKLRKVVAFRLNHLLKTGKINGKESKSGIRYAN